MGTELVTEIAEYRPIAAALHDLYSRHAGVVHDVTTTAGMAACRAARAEIRTCRTSLEAKRKEIKAPALERCRLIDADAKRITEILLAIEDPYDAQIKAEEAAVEARREAKRRAEVERLAELRRLVEEIREWKFDSVGMTAHELREFAKSCEATNIDAYPEEVRQECAEAKEETLGKLRHILAAREVREAEEARLAAERERQAAEDKRLREERQRVEALRQQAVREAAAERARWEKEQATERAEERARLEREALEAQELLETQRAELERKREEMERELAEERARINHEREDRGLAPPSPSSVPSPPSTTAMRVLFEKQGGYYHCQVFTAPRPVVTFETKGDLVFREAEWTDILLLMRGAEFVELEAEWP